MPDTPERKAEMQKILEEIWELEKQIEKDLEAKGIKRVSIMSEGNDKINSTRKENNV